MSDHHRYKLRDFDVAQQLTTLRRKASLTQEDVAQRIGISEKSIRNWEGGSNYPSELNLRKLIEIYLDNNAFAVGREQDEARLLWELLHERTPHRIGSIDEPWLANTLQEWQARSTSQAQSVSGSQRRMQPWSGKTHPLEPLSTLEVEYQGFSSPRSSSRLLRGEWNEALDVSALYGRTDELAKLERWLLVDQCRLVALLGMGGIGKTALAVKLVRQIAPRFDCVLWRSLQNAPSLEELLRDWIPAISEQRSTHLPQGIDQSLALLVKLLQERRCLLVLDNLETLFQEGLLEGRYRAGYEEYAMLIQHVAASVHRSCVLLTCRELFPDLGVFTGKRAPVRVLKLDGLELSASQQMLQDKGLFGGQDAWSDLVQRYAGNPLALKIVAETVHELFGGDITAFLAEGFTTFRGIRELLTQQFERLSALEQELMYWLAIERELIPLDALRAELRYPVSKSEVIEAMHSLRSRSLVERGEHGAVFTLQPVVLEYVTERLVALVSKEIHESKPTLLLTHALLQSQAKDYLRTSQARLIIQPVLDRLLSHGGITPGLEEQLERLLPQLRVLPRAAQGYGGGNLVNLLVCLNGHIKGKDCSHLTVWQADLQGIEAQDANFIESDLAGSVFMEAFETVASVALSANGQYLASGSSNGQIHLWQVKDGQPLLSLVGHTHMVWSLVFNPESTRLVSGSYDGLVKVWEVSSGQCVSALQGHTKWVRSLAVHPAGKLLATCSDDGSIRFWDLLAGRYTRVWHEQDGGIWSLAFSPDGGLLASGDTNGVVKLWDLASEQCLWTITANLGSEAFSQHAIHSLAFSPDGKLLVSGGQDARIMLWETSSGEHLNTLSGHTDRIYSVAFNAQGLLASSSQDRSVKLWQVGQRGETAQCLGTLHGHASHIRSVVFGPGDLLVSGSMDGVIKLWQVNKEGSGGRCLRTLHSYSCLINAVAFSPDGQLLVSGEQNGTLRIWETKSGRCLRVLSRHAGGSFALAFCPDGEIFAHGSSDNAIKLWDVASGRCLRTLQGHQGQIWSVAFSPDGRFLLTGSIDMTIKRWEVSSGHCLTTFEGHRNWVWPVACSPNGTLLASGDVDGVVKLWDISSGECLKTLRGSSKGILALMFTPDGQKLLSNNGQDLVTVWDVESGHCLETIPGIEGTYWLRSIAFSADGSLLAVASRDQAVKIWNVSSGELLHTFPCHAGQLWVVALSPDQQLLASTTDEGTIILWERQTGKCLMTLRGDRPYERMNISGVTGITEAQKASLKTLGAIESDK